jgi:hypothetical protein
LEIERYEENLIFSVRRDNNLLCKLGGGKFCTVLIRNVDLGIHTTPKKVFAR